MKRYLWAENLEDYSSDNEANETTEVIEIKRLNFFIGKNNSGKSRFLRKLLRSQHMLADNNFPDLSELIGSLKNIANNAGYDSVFQDNSYGEPITKSLIDLCIKMYSIPKYPIYTYKQSFLELKAKLDRYIVKDYYGQSDRNWINETNRLNKEINQIANLQTEALKYYIPILRGMRPISQSQQEYSYVKRTKKDYFDNEPEDKEIITGESLYTELVECLLGEPEQRELIKEYQNALGQYFFDGNEVTLIPKHGKDVVHIKIGDEAQRPIHDLGDGLQQVETFAKPHAKKQPEHSSSCSGCFCVKSRQITPKIPFKCLIPRHCLPVQAATDTPILLAAFNRFTHIAFRWLCALTLLKPK